MSTVIFQDRLINIIIDLIIIILINLILIYSKLVYQYSRHIIQLTIFLMYILISHYIAHKIILV